MQRINHLRVREPEPEVPEARVPEQAPTAAPPAEAVPTVPAADPAANHASSLASEADIVFGGEATSLSVAAKLVSVAEGSILASSTVRASTVRCMGKLDGTVVADLLVVFPGASVTGQVSAREVHCRGLVDGHLKADKVFLFKAGTLAGRVTCREIATEPGGTVAATIETVAPEAAPARPARKGLGGLFRAVG